MGIKNDNTSMRDFLNKIFSIDTKNASRVIIYILGIKIRFLKAEYKNKINEYKSLECPIGELPKAEGMLRKIQLASLKFLLIVDKICKENEIQYWSDFGNLLGAVRHGGFIPWDDDCDICMLRDHYDNFIMLFEKNPEKYPDIYIEFDNNGKNRCFVKIKHRQVKGISIDVFPFDYYYKKTNEQEKLELTDEIRKYNSRLGVKFCPFYINSTKMVRKRITKFTKEFLNKNQPVNKEIEPSIFSGVDFPQRNINLVFDYETYFPLQQII